MPNMFALVGEMLTVFGYTALLCVVSTIWKVENFPDGSGVFKVCVGLWLVCEWWEVEQRWNSSNKDKPCPANTCVQPAHLVWLKRKWAVWERGRERAVQSGTKPRRQREVSVTSEEGGGWRGVASSAETLATPIWLQTDKREYCSRKL